jgi:hypothetical protein
MEQALSINNFCAWDTASGASFGLVRLLLGTLVMTPIADRSNGIKIILCQLPMLLIFEMFFSVFVACRLWVNGIYMSINAASLFVSSTSRKCGKLQ